MPQFYFIPKRLARKAPVLTSIAQSVEAFGFRCIFKAMRLLSISNARNLAAFVFGVLGPFSDKAKKAETNLAIAFPDSTEEWRKQTTKKIFRSLGESTAELIKLEDIWNEREQLIEFVVEPEARKLMEQKRAAIYITAHIGPWQVAPLITKHFGITINTMYSPESNSVVAELMLDLRKFLGEKLIASDAGPRPMIRELNAGNSINMAMDTRLDSGKLVPFFDREALTTTVPAALALKTDSALVVARAQRLPKGRYRIIVYDPLQSTHPEAPQKEQALELTAQINRHFESWIREYPDQWICLKRRWPKAHKL
ncbi:MAG: lysophospholipid acyltransferase family protein [Pseudomonadota bacterium]